MTVRINGGQIMFELLLLSRKRAQLVFIVFSEHFSSFLM